jgi:hypothetical protein
MERVNEYLDADHINDNDDCCIPIFGCNDDNTTNQNTASNASNNMNTTSTSSFCCFGSQSNSFSFNDILSVHPAEREDPTCLGMKGTISLRRSNDIYNEGLTFSLIVRNRLRSTGYDTIDFECQTEQMYFLLLQGFILLMEEATARRERNQSDKNKEHFESLKNLWHSANDAITASMVQTDPINALFERNNNLDPGILIPLLLLIIDSNINY